MNFVIHSNYDFCFTCLFKGLTELKTKTGQFLTSTGCTDYRYWYLMTEALCWSVTIWSGRPQWQEGYWLGKSGHRRWIWCSEGQRTLSTTRGRGGVKKCQNFADVFYGWPHITLNSKKRHTNNSNSSDCISSINSCSYLLCRRPHTDRRPSFLEMAQPAHSKTASLPVAQQHQSRPVWNGLLSSPLQCSSVVNIAWKKLRLANFGIYNHSED